MKIQRPSVLGFGPKLHHDIMMMELITPFKFDEYVYPACLPPSTFKVDRDAVPLSGVGDEREGRFAVFESAQFTVLFFSTHYFW